MTRKSVIRQATACAQREQCQNHKRKLQMLPRNGGTPAPNVSSTANRAAIGHPSHFDSGEFQFSQGSRVQGPLSHIDHGSRFATVIAHTGTPYHCRSAPDPAAAGWAMGTASTDKVQTNIWYPTSSSRVAVNSNPHRDKAEQGRSAQRVAAHATSTVTPEKPVQFPTVFCGRGSARQGPRRERTQCQRADETKGRDT